MKRSTRYIKKALVTFLVVLMSINTFAAVVGDNDGAAFITKAEFDSLKNDFQSQLDRYNSSIDNKIDGAIASYLAGVGIAQKRELKPLVTNYSDMLWLNDFKIYGQYLKWTSQTVKTHDSTADEWYTPNLGERRMQLTNRNDASALIIWDIWQMSNYTKMDFTLRFPITAMSGMTYISNWGLKNPSFGDVSMPVGAIYMVKDDKYGWLVNTSQPVTYVEGLMNTIECLPHSVDDTGGTTGNDWWDYRWGGVYTLKDFKIQTPSANELLVWGVTTNNYRPASGAMEDHITASHLTLKNTIFPSLQFFRNPVVGLSPWTECWAYLQTNPDQSSYADSKWYQDGVSVCLFSSSNYQRQYNAFKYMMFGRDVNDIVNILKWSQHAVPNHAFADMSDPLNNAGSCELCIKGDYVKMVVNQSDYAQQGSSSLDGLDTATGTFQVPNLPRDYLKNLSTGVFRYNNTVIPFGNGLILLADADNSGVLKLSFNYKIGNIINDTVYTNSKDLYFDIKKADFLSTATDYYDGYIGDININTTTDSLKSFNNYKYPDRTGKVSLSIPVVKGENMYIRLRPSDESGGYYAKMSDLKMTFEIQS